MRYKAPYKKDCDPLEILPKDKLLEAIEDLDADEQLKRLLKVIAKRIR